MRKGDSYSSSVTPLEEGGQKDTTILNYVVFTKNKKGWMSQGCGSAVLSRGPFSVPRPKERDQDATFGKTSGFHTRKKIGALPPGHPEERRDRGKRFLMP